MTNQVSTKDWHWQDLLVLTLVLLTCLPALVFRYLPMADLPQHMAIAAVLANPTDTGLGYDEHYVVNYGSTLYLLPYLWTVGFSKFMGLELAMRSVVFLSMALFPIGIWSILRAQSKPVLWTILALPFVYNRAFFWGFFNFNLSISLALICIGLMMSNRRKLWRSCLLGLLGLAVSTTHIYGMAFLVGYAVLGLALGGRLDFLRRFLPLVPALFTLGVWAVLAQDGMTFGRTIFYEITPLSMRLVQFPQEVMGGYTDDSEWWLLIGWVFALGAIGSESWNRTKWTWSSLSRIERLFAVYAVLNLTLYFVLPQHTPSAKFVHFRHAFLALVLWPLVLPYRRPSQERSEQSPWGMVGLGVLALMTLMTHWSHLHAFDQEASDFDAVAEMVPNSPRVLPMNLDTSGQISRTDPYAHFVGYIQVRKGGTFATTFPQHFWNIPLSMVENSERSHTPIAFEFLPLGPVFEPSAFDLQPDWTHWYTHAVARVPDDTLIPPSNQFPFQLVHQSGVWQLYERMEMGTQDGSVKSIPE